MRKYLHTIPALLIMAYVLYFMITTWWEYPREYTIAVLLLWAAMTAFEKIRARRGKP
jgi:hypothetical protein